MRESDHIRALLSLDPAHLAPEDREARHPACLYLREPWAASPVRPFPKAANTRALAHYALDIVGGKRRGGIQSALMRYARDLHDARIPRAVALAELAAYHDQLRLYVETARRRKEARNAG